MSSSAIAFSAREQDTPWQRLYWTLPVAIAIWVAILWSFAVFMGGSNERLPEPAAIDAQLIEISEPTKAANAKPTQQSRPTPMPPIITPQPSLEKTPPPSPEVKPVVDTSNTTAPISPQETITPPRQEPGNTATENIAAKAIYKPIPQIPDELRQDALSASAVARFHVASDGTTTVELLRPTPNPKLNRLLLNTLKNWKFFPSMRDGKPTASVEQIAITIEVK